MPSHEPRNLTPPIVDPETSSQRKIVGLERAHLCSFCGGPSEATLGCPDETAPLISHIGICNNCLVDSALRRWSDVKHARLVQHGYDTIKAANAIRAARKRASWETYERDFDNLRHKREPNSEIEAEAARKLAEEEERIARKFDMAPGWSVDEFEKDLARGWRERKTHS
jgi:hypothetical protein